MCVYVYFLKLYTDLSSHIVDGRKKLGEVTMDVPKKTKSYNDVRRYFSFVSEAFLFPSCFSTQSFPSWKLFAASHFIDDRSATCFGN